MKEPETQAQRGVVLITVVLVIAVLSVIVVDFIYSTRVSYEMFSNSAEGVKAGHIAKSGVKVAKSVIGKKVLEDIPVRGMMKQFITSEKGPGGWTLSVNSFPAGTGIISLKLYDERSKINLNALVDQQTNRVDFQVRTQLIELLRIVGVKEEKSDLFIASLVNWLDRPGKNIINDQDPEGATAAHYTALENPYYIKDGMLDSLEEIKMIHGMNDALFSKVGRYLTVYPADKKVNFSTASREVIIATIKASAVTVTERRDKPREIKDRVAETVADKVIAKRLLSRIISLDEAKKTLKQIDSTTNISSGLSGLVHKEGKSDIYTVVSTGMTGEQRDLYKQVRAVIWKNQNENQTKTVVVSWQEI